jgi:L,D-transpeptidase YcbB
MSKFWSCQAVAGTAAVVALTVSASATPLPTPSPARAPESNAAAPTSPSTATIGSDVLTSGSTILMADVLVGEKLKELVSKRIDRYITRKRDREGVETFYREKGYAPVWIGNGAPNLRTTAVTAMMRSADADGLDPSSYHIPDFRAAGGDPEKLAEAELRLTDAVLTYARHAQAGRFGAQRITVELDVTQTLPDAIAVLKKVSQASNAAAALNGYNPPHAEYRALKARLAELRQGGAATSEARIPEGAVLTKGMKDPRVPALRKRLNIVGNDRDFTYDDRLFNAVRVFQSQNRLKTSGVIGSATIAALNGAGSNLSRGHQIDLIIANMERWRWLPRDLGGSYVAINIPDYTLKVVNGGRPVWGTRVVVGKPETQTPLLSAEIDNILLNPTWHVPESIIYNEYLPALQRDPRILQRMGLVLEKAPDGKVVVKQPPGEANALGRMKVNFSNRFQVYLHDTPTKHLFARPHRAFSHGCMRVENPAKFGEVLLSIANPRDNFTEERLQQGWGGPEHWIKLRRKVPVHVVYFSAYVDDNGKLVVRNDVYGFDRKMIAILKGDDHRTAESYFVAAPKPTVVDPERRRELERFVNNPRTAGPSDFFERLFR